MTRKGHEEGVRGADYIGVFYLLYSCATCTFLYVYDAPIRKAFLLNRVKARAVSGPQVPSPVLKCLFYALKSFSATMLSKIKHLIFPIGIFPNN